MSNLATVLALFFSIGTVVALLVLVRDVVTRRAGSSPVLLIGLGTLFIGERVLGEGDLRLPISGAGLLLVLGAVGLRAYAMSNSDGARREGHRLGLIWTSISVASLLLYAMSLDPVVGALGFEEAGRDRWVGVFQSLFPIVALIGLIPSFLIDRLLALHPIVMPAGASRSAQLSGLGAALAISLMFPVNYLANQHDLDWDVAYFRTTRAGDSTRALVSTLTDPVEVLLFFPSGNDVGREVLPYFEELVASSDDRMSVRMVDQALEPQLAEELKIRENGHVVLRQGESQQKFKLNTDLDRAKRELRKLDGTVQKNLLKLTRGQRTVYFLAGHGEANWRETENTFRKINIYKRDLLEGTLSVKVKTFGVADGSTNAVPDDASVVVVAGPTEPLLAEEITALQRYFDGGGSLLVMIDPEGDPLTELLSHLGVKPGAAVLANAEAHAQIQGGPADRVFIATNKYGSHASVKELSRNSSVAHMVFSTAMSVQKQEGTANKITTLIRSRPNTWEDLNGNFQADPGEPKKTFELAAAITKPMDDAAEGAPEEARAIVVGDVGYLSDVLISRLKANAVFSLDGFKWLTHDEEIVGAIETEEDVKVQHTREEDWIWFLAAVVAVPSMVLLVGFLFIRMRQRRN
ncbi:MAG TPA: hypothetical protein ENK18_17340 [Deltaproteobacteria bacterium]|nr:hypothetical protein [Deltaproteobacteria bacterium]